MPQRKSFLLRIDPRAYAALERWARDEFRSVNGQIEFLLYRALRQAGRVKPPGEKGQTAAGDGSERP